MIDIGKLRNRVTVQKKVRGVDEGLGAPVTFENDGQIWAEFLKQRISSAVIADDGAAVLVTQGILIRPREVQKGWRIVFGNHVFEIIDVDHSDPAAYVLTTQEIRP